MESSSTVLQPVVPANSTPRPFWSALVQCNPFYLASALLLIYGVYRIAIDPNLFRTDTRQLLFNFAALKVYSGMLVVAAIFLARRAIWYDSTLLFFLENILVLIPFMLISHAVFLEPGTAWSLCLIGASMVGLRFGAFAKKFPNLNLPRELLGAGAAILAFNIAVPLFFRAVVENDSNATELWTSRSLYCWYLALPLMALLGRILPHPTSETTPLNSHQQRWIPLAIFLLWIVSTATHLGTIGYVDDQVFALKLIVPLLWAIAWLLVDRSADFVRSLNVYSEPNLLLIPALIPLLALPAGEKTMFIALSAINILNFTTLFLLRRFPVALNLAIASTAAAYALLPQTAFPSMPLGISKWELAAGIGFSIGFITALRSRNARGGILGAICLCAGIAGLFHEHDSAGPLAFQAAMIFHLLHSLRWETPLERGANFSAVTAGILYLINVYALREHTALWATLLPVITACILLAGIAILERKLTKRTVLIASAAFAGMVLKPSIDLVGWIMRAPIGALALIASFALFGLGTLHALRGRALLARFRK